MMRLEEFDQKKNLEDMTVEELEVYMLSIVESMNETLDKINQRFLKDQNVTNRKTNQKVPPKHSPAI